MKYWKHLLLLIAWLQPVAAAAQFTLPNPAAPTLVAPASGALLRGEAPGLTSLVLKWNQWGVISSPQQPLPSYFVTCVKPASQVANCSFTSAAFLPVGSLSSSRIYSGFVLVGYQYALTVPVAGTTISDTLLDTDLTLSVGACRGSSASACSFSTPSPLYLASRDLRPRNVSTLHTSTHAVYLHRFRNEGSTTIPNLPIRVQVVEWEALLNNSFQCRTDINSTDVKNDGSVIVFMVNGDGRWMVDLPLVGGQRTAPATVVGMHRWVGGANVLADTLPFASALPAGLQGEVSLQFPLPNSQRPRGYINVTNVDPAGAIREFDETNNRRAECDVVPHDG